MISQKCPKCGSNRVRHGYRPTPLWSKFIFRYNLLCDNCNWEFTGFAIPGTVSSKPTRRQKKTTLPEISIAVEPNDSNLKEVSADETPVTNELAAVASVNGNLSSVEEPDEAAAKKPRKVKKKVKIRL